MATGQSILDRMELIDQELQLQAAEADVVRGLVAVNVAQDYLESLLALNPEVWGDTVGTVTTSAGTETTTFPSNVLRIDRLQLIDATTSRPKRDLDNIRRTGGHSRGRYWPYSLFGSSTATGEPHGYWTDGLLIYWDPLPDATHTVRWYGFAHKTDITAAGAILYPDTALMPLATFATKLMAIGKGDGPGDLDSLADQTFGPLIRGLGNFNRDGAVGLEYESFHTT